MKPIYLEPDEEITSVVERLGDIDEDKIAVVVPKNSTLFQSLVNLKLLSRQAKKLGKSVVLISANKVGVRLAKQVGIDTYSTIGSVVANAVPSDSNIAQVNPEVKPIPASDVLPDGTPINRYSSDAISSTSGTENEPTAITQPETKSVAQIENITESDDGPEAKEVVESDPANSEEVIEDDSSQETVVEKPSLPTFISRGVNSHRDRTPFIFPWKSAIVALTMILVAFVVTFLFLPKATVTLTFPAKLINEKFNVEVKTTPAEGEKIVPGSLITASASSSKEVTATGKKDVGTKAGGTISVKNCEDTNSRSLPAGSKATSAGKGFTTNSTVTIPAGQFSSGGTVCNSTSATVAVTAETAGSDFNLSNANFALAGMPTRISGTGSTSGGTTKQITVLSQEDVDSAYAELTNKLKTDSLTDLKAKSAEQTVLDDSIKVEVRVQKVDKEVGAETDKANVTVGVDSNAIAYDSAKILEISTQVLTLKLETGQKLIFNEGQKPVVTYVSLSDDLTTMTVGVDTSGFAGPDINKFSLASEIKNKSVSNAVSFLKEKHAADEVTIEIIPGWWIKRLPLLSQAISVEYGLHEISEP